MMKTSYLYTSLLATTMAGACGSSGTTAKPSLPAMNTMGMIGSTIDPVEHGTNPYGLVIASATVGPITKGDLVICNFNDGATGTQGAGTTIVGLHPTAGAAPYRIAQDASLAGCNALTMLPDDTISVSAYTTNQNPLVTAAGVVSNPFASDTFYQPWGEAYAAAAGNKPAALYISNSMPGHGTIDRVTLSGDGQAQFTEIASGFCAAGSPGSIYAPSGLTYDEAIDTLYIVDTSSNSVIELADVSAIGADGVVAAGHCTPTPPTPVPTFSGASASKAKVIASGGMFNAPISAALLANGNLIVGNGDLSSTSSAPPNLMFEVSPNKGVVATKQVDTGNPGALFGIVATVDAQGDQLVYFNDDNMNAVMRLSK